MLDVALTPLAKRALQAIAAAGVDPGLLGWGELRDRLHTSDQVLSRTANRLEDEGLLVQEGWDGARYSRVRLTGPGRDFCTCRGWRGDADA